MRQVENITPYSLWNDIPTVVIVVYDPTDRLSMGRVAALLRMEHSAWLPRTSRLALASSGSTWAAALPVWRLKRRAKRHMGQVYVSDLRDRESTRTLFDWTLEEATTRPVPDLDPAEHETSFFEIDDPMYWSKLRYHPPGTRFLRKVVSMFTLRSSKSSHGSEEDGSPSYFPSPGGEDEDPNSTSRPHMNGES